MNEVMTPHIRSLEQGRFIELLERIRLVVFDFDGVFTDNMVYVTESGVESVRCWRSDGLGLSRLQTVGVHVLIVSTETNPVVMMRARKLKCPCRQGVDDKAVAILDACRELDVEPGQVAFVGNDINDIPAFKTVALPIAVADASTEVYPFVLHRTVKAGGLGAVREVCDLVFHAKQGALSQLDHYAQ